MDNYLNVLYVKELFVEFLYLVYYLVVIDKYIFEICCVVGNYYSLKSMYVKVVVYFKCVLKFNLWYLSVWILMGYEYVEMKNLVVVIDVYRYVVDINSRDYRAWYGLG